MVKRFGSRKLDIDIWREMMDRKEKFNENFCEFFDDMMDLRYKPTKEIPDVDIFNLIKQNSARCIRYHVYPQPINSIEDLFAACSVIETVFSKDKDSRISNEVTRLKPRNTVFEIASSECVESEETDDDDVEEKCLWVEAIFQSQHEQISKTPKNLSGKYPAQR